MRKKLFIVVSALCIFTLAACSDNISTEPDLSSPEKALQSIENAYRSKNLSEVLACKDFELEAMFFLGRTADFSGYQETLQQFAGTLEEKFKQRLERSFPEWNGVTARVIKKEELPGDMVIITEELELPTGQKMTQRIFVGKRDSVWKVLMPYSDKLKNTWLESQQAAPKS